MNEDIPSAQLLDDRLVENQEPSNVSAEPVPVAYLKQKWLQLEREQLENKVKSNLDSARKVPDVTSRPQRRVFEAPKAQVVEAPKVQVVVAPTEDLNEEPRRNVAQLKGVYTQKQVEHEANQKKYHPFHHVGTTENAKELAKRFGLFMTTTINEKTVTFLIDAEERKTILNAADYKLIGTPALKVSKFQPSAKYSQRTVHGSCDLTITYEGVAYSNHCVMAVDINGKSVMGKDMLRRIVGNTTTDKQDGEAFTRSTPRIFSTSALTLGSTF